jgi:pyruvate-formate lyase-activating enzyme
MMRKCSHCKELLPVEAYHLDRNHPTGYHRWCKDCRRELEGEAKKIAQRSYRARGGYKRPSAAAPAPIPVCVGEPAYA